MIFVNAIIITQTSCVELPETQRESTSLLPGKAYRDSVGEH
jgi:hypothetical protein